MFGMIKNSLFGGTEEIKYTVLEKETKGDGSYELRSYESGRYATVTCEGKNFDQATGECVKKLLMYVGGSNDRGEGMGMTAPISITAFPNEDGSFLDRFVIALRLPERYQENPPSPTDSTIKFEERPAMTVYSLQFGGFAKENEYRTEASRLTRILGESAFYKRDTYFCSGYDPPMKPYGRRNEVWFIKEN